MQVEIKTPDLGEGVESADVVSVMVSVGDEIAVDQSIIELETEKAVAEVPSPQAGRVAAIHVKPGDTVTPDSLLLTVEAKESAGGARPSPVQREDRGAAPRAASPGAASPEAKSAAPAPRQAEPEPTPREQPQRLEQTPRQTKTSARELAQRSHEAEGQPEEPPAAPAGPPAVSVPQETPAADVPAGPEVRRLAREIGIDLRHVQGTAPGGRVTREDVLAAAREVQQRAAMERQAAPPTASGQGQGAPARAPAAATEAGAEPSGESGQDDFGPVRREKVTRIRRTIAEQMSRSMYTLPHVTNFDQADVTDLETFRQQHKEAFAARGVKLTLLPFVVRAVVEALRKHPAVNATLDLDGGQIVYKHYYNVGLAVDTDRGLLVPVLQDAACLSIAEIARQSAELAERARNAKLQLHQMRGGTFTISNLGSIGGMYSTPVINYPESAILLLGRARQTPVVRNDQVVARLVLPLSLSYDHRLIDGATAGRFLNDIIEHLQDPARLLLE